jgi:hypothetical protein
MKKPEDLPNYWSAVFKHIQGKQIDGGTVHHIEVLHEDDCSFWAGKPCDCDPTIVSGEAVDKKYRGTP